jgi:hypothetical protein
MVMGLMAAIQAVQKVEVPNIHAAPMMNYCQVLLLAATDHGMRPLT